MTIIQRELKGICYSGLTRLGAGCLLLFLLAGCETSQMGKQGLKKRLDKVESEVMAAEAAAAAELASGESQSPSSIAGIETGTTPGTESGPSPGDSSTAVAANTTSLPTVPLNSGAGAGTGTEDENSDVAGSDSGKTVASVTTTRPREQETVPPHRNWDEGINSGGFLAGSATNTPASSNNIVTGNSELELQLNSYLSTRRYAEASQWVEGLTNITSSTRAYLNRLITDDLYKQALVLTDRLIQEKRYFTAYRLIQKNNLEAEMQELKTKVVDEGTQFYLTQSQLRYETGRASPDERDIQLARSYLEAFKALEMRPESTTAQTWYERCRAEMQPGLNAKVVIGGVSVNGKRTGNASRYFSNRLQNEIQLPFGFQLQRNNNEESDFNQVWAESATGSEPLYLITAQVSNTLSEENLDLWIRDSGSAGGNTATILGIGEAFISILDLTQSAPVMVETPPISISLKIRDFPGVTFDSNIESPIVQARNTVERELLSQLADGVQSFIQRAFDNRARQRLIDWRDKARPATLMSTSPQSIEALAKGILYCNELGLDDNHPIRRQLEEIYLQRLTEKDYLN